MVIGLWFLQKKKWYLLSRVRLFSGIIIALVVMLPWLILVQHQNHNFLHYFFIYQQFQRFAENNYNDIEPVWFYLEVIILGLGAWAALLPSSLKLAYKKQNSYDHLFLIWIISILIFFTIPSSKLIGYIIPVSPPISILIGRYCTYLLNNNYAKTISVKIAAFLVVIILITASIVLFYITKNVTIWKGVTEYFWLPIILSIVFIAYLFFIWIKKCGLKAFYIYIAIGMATFILLLNNVIAFVITRNTYALTTQFKDQLNSNTMVINYYQYNYDLGFYLNHPIYVVADWKNHAKSNDDSIFTLWAKECYPNLSTCPALIAPDNLSEIIHTHKVYIILNNNQAELNQLKNLLPNYSIITKDNNNIVITN